MCVFFFLYLFNINSGGRGQAALLCLLIPFSKGTKVEAQLSERPAFMVWFGKSSTSPTFWSFLFPSSEG